ncbi:response regulator [Paenibacillus silviterrae]|uniref:response regulator n=1 Tax=Paenibacillus silviterrae TaxID=3242194 RepID=UPI002542CE23|nr:response regulator [Paenibacillus chinjuensis]
MSYRLLIADDEALEREGLEWIVRNQMPGRFQVIHAENGRTAIERAEEHRPHIVMMDVNMPGIQGLAAIREIKQRLPETKFVLVTAYDYFAYAKEALTLGVSSYIVKPAKRDELVGTLEQLVQELEEEKRKRTDELKLRDKMFQLEPLMENELSLMFMVDQIVETDARLLSEWLDFPLEEGCALVVAFPPDIRSLDQRKIYDSLRSFVKTNGLPCIVSSLIDLHMTVFLHKRSELSGTAWLEHVKKYGEQLCSFANRQLGIDIFVGIGSEGKEAAGFRKSYFEAVIASTCSENGGTVCHFDELKQGKEVSAREASKSSADSDGLHRSYVTAALQRIREERELQTLTVLDRAKKYITERYTEEVSLEEVADYVHLNPHYFSKIFKQQFGDTFIDFVTRLRIDKAKILIAEARLSLKEVCYEVGYKDPNYFSRVFKKVTGFTPTEYRTQIQ